MDETFIPCNFKPTYNRSKSWNILNDNDLNYLRECTYIMEIIYLGKANYDKTVLLNIKCFRTFLWFYDKLHIRDLKLIYHNWSVIYGLSPISLDYDRNDEFWLNVDYKYFINAMNRLSKHWQNRIRPVI